jgi:hypothetical protein
MINNAGPTNPRGEADRMAAEKSAYCTGIALDLRAQFRGSDDLIAPCGQFVGSRGR